MAPRRRLQGRDPQLPRRPLTRPARLRCLAHRQGLRRCRNFLFSCQRVRSPRLLLTDSAAVFSGSSRRGRLLLGSECDRLGIVCKHSTPYHLQTCGKVERLHHTLKRFLSRQPPAQSLAHLQAQLDAFRTYYNRSRPHGALNARTPATAFAARVKAGPATDETSVQYRVPAMTASTAAAPSPSAASAACATSASAPPTLTAWSASLWPAPRFESSARTARSSAN